MSHVLIVEDNSDIATLYTTIFSEHNTVVLDDLPKAFMYLSTHRPDLIITDFHLPSGNSNELIGYVRRSVNLWRVPIVGISVDDTWQTEAYERGVSAFMTKPIDISELISMARTLLASPTDTQTDTGLAPQAVLAGYVSAYEVVYHRKPDCYWTGRHFLIDRQRCDQRWLLSETERLRNLVKQPSHPRNALLRLIDKIRKI